jgi:hypothetical protein
LCEGKIVFRLLFFSARGKLRTMSRRSDRRRHLLQRSQKFQRERVREAQEKLGLDGSHQLLHTDAIAKVHPAGEEEIFEQTDRERAADREREGEGDADKDSREVVESPDPDLNEIGRAPGELPASSPFESEGPTRFRVLCYTEKTVSGRSFRTWTG